MKQLIILGSGGYGHTVADVATQFGYDCVFLDDAIPDHPLSSFTNYISSSPAYDSTSQPSTSPVNHNSTDEVEKDEKVNKVEFAVAFGIG